MAIWSVTTEPDGRRAVRYLNVSTNKTFECALDQPHRLPLDLVFDWVASEADPEDLLTLDGVLVSYIQRRGAA